MEYGRIPFDCMEYGRIPFDCMEYGRIPGISMVFGVLGKYEFDEYLVYGTGGKVSIGWQESERTMDLYGDLPPTSDGNSDLSPVVIGEGWAGLSKTAIQNNKAPGPAEKKNIKMNFVAPPAVRKPTTSFAAFKPRQTAKPVTTGSTPVASSKVAAPAFSLHSTVVTEEVIVRKKPEEPGIVSNITPCIQSSDTNYPTLTNKEELPTSPRKSPVTAVATYECADPYDPSKPNDYIQWCEERLDRRRMRRLEDENRRTLQAQEEQRIAKEKERAEALERGDLAKLQATLPSMGRGRGRGVSNLPAWMTAGDGGGLGGGLRSEVSEEEAPLNMRPPGQFDDDTSPHVERSPDGGRRSDLSMREEQRNEGNRSRSDGGDVGARILGNMGFTGGEGRGLGRDGQGIVNPIQVRSAGGQGVMEVADDDKRRFLQGSGESDHGRRGEGGDGGAKRRRGLFAAPSCVVLLKNMVGAGEVDDCLAAETKEECRKYGEVKECVIREVPDFLFASAVPEEERVRTFVCFERQDSAVRAFRDLNGRFFGGRQIVATFYDEEKFARCDLEPSQGEW